MRVTGKLALLAALVTGSGALVTLISPSTPATAGSGTPVFATYVSPTNLSGRDQSGEPSIGINWNTGATMYQSGVSTYRVTFNDSVTPATASWSDVTSLYTRWVNLDPILATDHVTGRTWAGGLEGPCSLLAHTDTDGSSWSPDVNPCTGTVDHETIGSGPWHGTPPSGATYSRAVYYCAQSPFDACATSKDGGQTYGTPVIASGSCSGLFGHVKVDDNGTAYVPNATCGGKVGGFKSTDNGASWQMYQISTAPSPSRGFDPSVATTPNHTVWESWARASDDHPMVAYSTTAGASWSTPVDLASTVSPALVATTFQAVTAGDDGRVAVAYLGTSTGGGASTPYDNGYHGVWYLYVSYTYDGGTTWTTIKASPDPVQRGCIWDGGGTNSCRNLLDFMDASVTKDGRVVVGYADGCVGTCAGASGTEAQSTSSVATIARQSTGKGLFAGYDTVPLAPTLTANPGNNKVNLSWTTPLPGGSAITGYNVYRGTTSGGETLLATLGVTNTYTDTTAVNGTTYYYQVAAVNSFGTSAMSNEVSATPAFSNTPPSACFTHTESTLTTSVDGSCSSDAEGPIASYSWSWGDGSPASTGATASHTYTTASSYNVVLTVTDSNGATATVSHIVVVSGSGDPDPTVPNLAPGIPAAGTSGAWNTWSYYKIFITPGTARLTVDLSSVPACYARCATDLNVAIRAGAKPIAPENTCPQSPVGGDVETCTVAAPGSGWYYVGVYTATAGPATNYTVTATVT